MTSNWNKNSPSVKIHATVTSSEGYDYENLSKVRGNFIPSTLRPSKISMLVISHAVMGRVRFMFYPCFFLLLLLLFCFVFVFVFVFFVLFCFCFVCFFVCLFLSVTRPKLPLSQILNQATCDVYSPKAVETLIQGHCYGYCFFICV